MFQTSTEDTIYDDKLFKKKKKTIVIKTVKLLNL